MSRATTSVQPALLITNKTRLDELPDIDPDAVNALQRAGIFTIHQLRRTNIDIAVTITRSMPARPLSASQNVRRLLQYRSMTLHPQGPAIHDRMRISEIPDIPPEVIQALSTRGITTLGQVRGRKSQIPTILQQTVPRYARATRIKIEQYLNPGSPIPHQATAP